MLCGHCRQFSAPGVQGLLDHFRESGCPWGRPVWKRVIEAVRRGHSGRRILSRHFPDQYKRSPMPVHVKERLRGLARARAEAGIQVPRLRRIRRVNGARSHRPRALNVRTFASCP